MSATSSQLVLLVNKPKIVEEEQKVSCEERQNVEFTVSQPMKRLLEKRVETSSLLMLNRG